MKYVCVFVRQRYPRESPARLQNLMFPDDDMDKLVRKERETLVQSVYWALFGAIYLCFGLPEVYRVLFEIFGMDPEDEDCQLKLRRQLEDVDYVSVEFEGKKLSWQDVAPYKPEDALFVHPRLFRAGVPPGMRQLQGNLWDFDSRPQVMETLGYPLAVKDRIPEITEARNVELGLGLQAVSLVPVIC